MEKTVVLVTGSNRGIGASCIEEFAKKQATVIINYCHHKEEAEELEKRIKDEYNVDTMTIKCDVSNSEEVEQMVNKIVDTFGGIDILVNNAGVSRDSLLLDKNIKEFKRVLDVNLIGTYLCSKYVGKVMLQRKKGKISGVRSTSRLRQLPRLLRNGFFSKEKHLPKIHTAPSHKRKFFSLQQGGNFHQCFFRCPEHQQTVLHYCYQYRYSRHAGHPGCKRIQFRHPVRLFQNHDHTKQSAHCQKVQHHVPQIVFIPFFSEQKILPFVFQPGVLLFFTVTSEIFSSVQFQGCLV